MHKALPSTSLYYYKACPSHVPVALCTTKLAQSTSQYYFVLHSLHKALPVLLCTTKLAQSYKALPSTTLYYTACTKHFPVLLCTTKLAQRTSQYYFVLQSLHNALPSTTLQSLHNALPSTTLYYTACTKHFPVLLCTTKFAQSTSQYYFVLQSLHKALPSTSLYYKACPSHVPELLCTTKLAQSTSQYFFVLQSLPKPRSRITLYYKACTKYFPVLLCGTLAQVHLSWGPLEGGALGGALASRGFSLCWCLLVAAAGPLRALYLVPRLRSTWQRHLGFCFARLGWLGISLCPSSSSDFSLPACGGPSHFPGLQPALVHLPASSCVPSTGGRGSRPHRD